MFEEIHDRDRALVRLSNVILDVLRENESYALFGFKSIHLFER